MIKADLLLTNAEFVTLDGPASAIAVLGGRIVALEEVPAREVVDLGGATVTPAFHDAHNHMAWFGLTLSEVDCRVGGLDALYAAVDAAPDGEWVVGFGYDQNKCGGHPTRDGLDRVARGRKVWIKHASGHMCVVNTPVLQEQAQQLVNPLVLPYPVDTLADAIDRAGRVYLSEGITSCVEAGIGGGWIGKSPVELEAYQRAREQGRLHVRVELMIAADVLYPVAELGLVLDLGIRTGFGDDWLRIGPVKIFSDGSLIGHTAALCHDFADSPGNHGYLQDSPDALRERIIAAHRGGWRVATHAISDAAIDLVLNAVEEAQRLDPRPDVRHRVEHFGVARPDQVERAVALGVIAVPQGRFVNEIGDGMLRAPGPDRAAWAYRQRSLLDAGMIVPGSSDRPVVHGAPLLAMHDMVEQLTSSGTPFSPARR